MPPALPLHGDLEHIVRRPKLRAELQGDDETTSALPFQTLHDIRKFAHYFLVNLCRQERALWAPALERAAHELSIREARASAERIAGRC